MSDAVSELAQARDYYLAKYEEVFDIPYLWLHGRHDKNMSTVVNTFGLEKTKKMIDLLLVIKDDWISMTDRSPGVLLYQVNLLAQKALAKKDKEGDMGVPL